MPDSPLILLYHLKHEESDFDRGSGFALSVPKKYDMVYSEQ